MMENKIDQQTEKLLAENNMTELKAMHLHAFKVATKGKDRPVLVVNARIHRTDT